MPDPVLYDPHLYVRFAAKTVAASVGPTELQLNQEIARGWNLGAYSLDEMQDLLGEIAGVIEEWVGNHPPHGQGQ